jgi:hypothetical protein
MVFPYLASDFFKAFNELPTSQGFGAHIGPLISYLEHYKGVAPDQGKRPVLAVCTESR